MLHYLTFSPQILLANFMSRSSMVMHFACIVQRFVALRRQIKYASVALCNANTALAYMWWSPCSFCKISLTSHKNGALGINKSMDFWNFHSSLKACVPRENHLLLPGVLPAFAFIFSSCFIPIRRVLPFTPLDVLPCIKVTKGNPILAHLQTVALVLAIFCDEKYLK